MKAYDNLMLTISMKLMAYSDHPFKGGRVFYTRRRYLEYLNGYADRFGLREHIRVSALVIGTTTLTAVSAPAVAPGAVLLAASVVAVPGLSDDFRGCSTAPR